MDNLNLPKVHSWFDPPPCPGEENSGELVVEREGYIPAHVEINELLAAGERLQQVRGEYEFKAEDEVPEGYIDPYRTPNIDYVDIDRLVGTLAHNMKKEMDEKRKLEEEKAEADANAAAEAHDKEVIEKHEAAKAGKK